MKQRKRTRHWGTRFISFWVVIGMSCALLILPCCEKRDRTAQASQTETIAFQDYDSGRRAYDAGNYHTAYKIWFPLANQGDNRAQFWIGFLYEVGLGVAKNPAEAVKWLSLSAEQGMGDAQARLCRLLMDGQGTPRDYVQAYKWASLGSYLGNPQCREVRIALDKAMTPAEIDAATRLAAEWNAKHSALTSKP